MKKILIPVGAIFIAGFSQAQLTTTENYVYTKTYLDYNGTTPSKTSETVQYFDGLGRPKQIVNVKASPLQRDVVTHIEYDGFGRQVKEYLPVPQTFTANGSIFTAPLDHASNPAVYGSEKIYSEKIVENSPLDRIQQQIQVGNDWSNKPVKFDYDVNTAGEVIKFTTTTTWVNNATKSEISNSGSYGTAQLYKNTVTDEDGNKTIEFKNGQGQVLLVRKMLDGTQSADTYYVYNEYDQLAFVIPPLASVSTLDENTLNNLCYQYRYDGRNHLVEKKLPGKGWEYMVYDKADRLILTQDANLRQTEKWMITKYDNFGRVIYTGLIPRPNETREALQNVAKNHIIVEGREGTGFSRNGLQIYYTTGYYYEIETVLSVNYYDSYLPGDPFPTMVYDQVVLPPDVQQYGVSTKGQLVSSFVKNIEDDNWTKTYYYYDLKGRPIREHSFNHLGGYTNVEKRLDFSGNPDIILTQHKRLATDTERIITEKFTYDHQNRLLTHTHQVDGNTVEYLAQNEYDELSQLKSKKVGGVSAGNGLQTVDYTYNIRGWMTGINDPNNLIGGDLFGYKIKYNQVEGQQIPNNDFSGLVVQPKYNGNIAEVDWRTNTTVGDNLRRYGYVYDGLNRLLAGFYQKDTNPAAKEYFEKLDYDLNGNITNLKRSSSTDGNTTAGLIDNLTYTYNYPVTGNQLNSVTDSSTDYRGYPETSGNTITYDLNGNMINHLDKNITEIKYNFLNLPIKVVQGRTYMYSYRADGTKLQKQNRKLNTVKITDYLDGFQYEKFNSDPSILKFIPTSEGYYDFVKNKYIYNYTDHLGNVRLSYFHNGSSIEVLEENNYYPFGLKHEGYNQLSGNPSYQYKYNGKELQESGMYDYGARFYMPDIGRWGVVDPLAEKMTRHSPYNYAFNNPIRFIDPDGRAPADDHFNKYGRYIGTDNKKTNNVVVHTNSSASKLSQLKGNTGAASLSQLDYSSRGTTKAVSNLLSHYASAKGISGHTGVYKGPKGSAYTNDRGNIFFNIKDLGNGTYNNAYNIKSTLNHEGGKLGHKNENINPDDYTFVDHAKVYLNEARNSDFGKTTQSYRAAQANSFGQRVLNAAEKNSSYGTNHMNMINEYNSGNTGNVSIDLDISGNGPKGALITVQIGNNVYPSKSYEDIKNPHD